MRLIKKTYVNREREINTVPTMKHLSVITNVLGHARSVQRNKISKICTKEFKVMVKSIVVRKIK